MHGARLWPGVLLGSFLLNAIHSGVFAEPDWATSRTFAALASPPAPRSQALAGRALVARFIGLPLRLTTLRDIAWLLALAGPVTCVIAASYRRRYAVCPRHRRPRAIRGNWLAWWSGDTLGVLVFMPLVLLAPGSRDQLTWRERHVGRLPLAALLLLLLPLGLTFYAWKATTENDYQRGEAKFDTLTIESEKALQNRLASYGNALLGAAGFIQGSSEVSREEWRTYVDTIRVRENFPGIQRHRLDAAGGRGRAARVPRAGRARTARRTSRFIRQATGGLNYIITFIEPEADNRAAIGLNIAFERTASRGRRRWRATPARRHDRPRRAGAGRHALARLPDVLPDLPPRRCRPAASKRVVRHSAAGPYAPLIARNFLART